MDLKNRARLEVEMRRAVKRVFKEYSEPSSRMPAWSNFKADMVEAVLPIMRKIQLSAIRDMFVRHGDGPAPPEAKPEALERATALAEDLASVSIGRWKELPRRKTPEMIAEWYKLNFGKHRASVIAVTETAIAHQTGEEIAWRHLRKKGVKLESYWVAEPDACERCLKMQGKPRKYWKRFYPRGPGSVHPSCRCHIEHEEVA
jgi:hypothetical protein